MALRAYRNEIYPSKELETCQENIDLFFKFMHKRQLIWNRRFVKHSPREKWTKDKILKTTKYTNVYRQLDRGSLWAYYVLIVPAKKKLKKYPQKRKYILKNLLWKLIAYRMCSRIETFEKIGIPNFNDFDPTIYMQQFKSVLKHHAPMTNAFLTCPCPKGLTKSDGIIMNLIDCHIKLNNVYKEIFDNDECKAETIFNSLRTIHGMGGFFCYEVYCDLCYSKLIPFTTNDFVNIGPGCMEGLRLLFPNIGTSKVKAKEKLYELHEKQNKHFKRLSLTFKYNNWLEPVDNNLSLRSIEHSLCEFSKYWLQRHNIGKRRLEYDKWKNHPKFTIADDGIHVKKDKDTYSHFKKMTKFYSQFPKSKKWRKFRKEISRKHNKEKLVSFTKEIMNL